MIKLSIIIPTYNRSDLIQKMIGKLMNLDFDKSEIEIIIVNDGSNDSTKVALESLKSNWSKSFNVYNIENLGRAGARNYGVSKSKGEILLFYDDDIIPNIESIFDHLYFHKKASSNCIYSGNCIYNKAKFSHEFHYYRNYLESKWTKKTQVYKSDSYRINGGNFSISRDSFEMIGGFDERLNDKEDFKLSFDLAVKIGGEIFINNLNKVYHEDYKSLKEYISRGINSRREEQKLQLIEPKILELQPERFVTKPKSVSKSLFFRIFKNNLVIDLLNNPGFTKRIPRKVLFKLYEYTITANVNYFEL